MSYGQAYRELGGFIQAEVDKEVRRMHSTYSGDDDLIEERSESPFRSAASKMYIALEDGISELCDWCEDEWQCTEDEEKAIDSVRFAMTSLKRLL